MKIVQVIHSLNPGGAERLVVDLSNEFASDLANEVTVVSLKNRAEKKEEFYAHELSEKVNYVRMGFGDGAKLSYLFALSKKIKALKPDVVNVHCQIHYILFAFLLNPKIKFVYTLHNSADFLLGGIRKYIAKFFSLFKRFKIVTISHSNRESLKKFVGLSNDVLIYNGRAVPQISSLYDKTKQEINSFKISEQDIVLLSIAKCSKQKNLQLLIESVNALSLKKYPITLLIIGDNYFNTEMGKKLVDLAGESIHFLGTKNNVGDYFYLCDAFCLSSIFEGMPITLLEAFACGCTPISTPVSGSIDIIEDRISGFISPDFTTKSYTETLEQFIQSKDNIDRALLKQVFEDNYSISKCASNYLSLYKADK